MSRANDTRAQAPHSPPAAATPPEPDDLAATIAQARRVVWSAAARRLEDYGESMLSFQVLNRLAIQGTLSQNALAFAIGQHAAGVSRMLESLEADGLVRRTRDREDRRRVLVELTEAGRARLQAIQPHLRVSSSKVLAPLTDEERCELKRLLDKLIASVIVAGR